MTLQLDREGNDFRAVPPFIPLQNNPSHSMLWPRSQSKVRNVQKHKQRKMPQAAPSKFFIVLANKFCSFCNGTRSRPHLVVKFLHVLIVAGGMVCACEWHIKNWKHETVPCSDLHVSVSLLDYDLDLRRGNRCDSGLLSLTVSEPPP